MSKKLFISADIEGTAGICNWRETEKGGDLYEKFAALMTAEVAAAAQAALDLGWEVTIKDAHDSARNIDPEKLPAGCRLIRGWTGEPLCMMAGLETGHFDAAAYTGYHADAYSSGNPLAHTMTPSAHRVTLNDRNASEFTLNAYAAAELGVPSVFLSGDAALCRDARELLPAITAVPTKTGIGGAVISKTPAEVCREIYDGMKRALLSDPAPCLPRLPEHFELEIEYSKHTDAQRCACYPGAQRVDAKTVRFGADSFAEINRAILFIL